MEKPQEFGDAFSCIKVYLGKLNREYLTVEKFLDGTTQFSKYVNNTGDIYLWKQRPEKPSADLRDANDAPFSSALETCLILPLKNSRKCRSVINTVLSSNLIKRNMPQQNNVHVTGFLIQACFVLMFPWCFCTHAQFSTKLMFNSCLVWFFNVQWHFKEFSNSTKYLCKTQPLSFPLLTLILFNLHNKTYFPGETGVQD